MVWAVRVDGISNYLELSSDVIINTNSSFEIEFEVKWDGSDYCRPFGRGDNFFSRCLLYGTSDQVQLRNNSGASATWTVDPYTRTDFNVFRFSRPGVSTTELFINGISQGTREISGPIIFNKLFLQSASVSAESELKYLTVTETGGENYNWDATLSDHNSTTLSDFGGLSNDASFAGGMTTANWIDLGGGGNEYIITGDSSVTVVPSADFAIQRSYTIVGDVPVVLTPVADFLLNRSYSIGGQSSLELSPNSGFELNREYIFSGDVPFNILPNSETLYSSGNSIDGDVSYSVIPTALFEINRSYSIDGLTNIEFTVQSSKQKNINVVVDGNVPIEVTPSANFQFGIENIIDGDVNFNITPDSSFVFNRQYVLNGSIGINLTPDSETETTKNYIYNGQSEVSFNVEGEFEFDGQKLISGDVQINVLPNSEMVLDRVQVIKDPLFTLSVEDEVITLSVESSVEVIYAVAR